MRVLSLFSGCGGMDIGFQGGFQCLRRSVNEQMHPDWIESENGSFVMLKPTGFQTVFANDIRRDAKTAWVNYMSQYDRNAEQIYRLESVVNLVRQAQAGQSVFPDDIDVVTGGFPCQSFSVAGKRLGLSDLRNHLGNIIEHPNIENRGMLYIWMREVISLVQPKLFVAENVKGLTNFGNVKTIMEHDFAQAGEGGYLVVPAQVLCAADYGVPQSRERVIFFGFRRDCLTHDAMVGLSQDEMPPQYDPYPHKTHGEGLCPYVTCQDAFVELEEPEISTDISQQRYSGAKYMGKHCQGQSEVKLDCIGPTIRSEHHGNIEFRRLSAEHGGRHMEELHDGLQERRMTVRECARLQTFPDNYQFILPKTQEYPAVSASSAYQLIGNAVPCMLAYNIAQNLKAKWKALFHS